MKFITTDYHALETKIYNFKIRKGKINYPKKDFSVQDVIDKFGQNPVCYLSGHQIDLKNGNTYNLDHIKPTSKGGTNELDNLGLLHPYVNLMKAFFPIELVIRICKEIVIHNGYKVEKII